MIETKNGGRASGDMVGQNLEGAGTRATGSPAVSIPLAVTKAVAAGEIVLWGEYCFTKAEAFEYTDKKSGALKQLQILRHTVLGKCEAYPVTEFLKTGKAEDYVSPFARGERVLVSITGLFQEKGVSSIKGTLSKI